MLSSLVLVPTDYELGCLTPLFHQKLRAIQGAVQVCGFGPTLSGIMATRLIAEFSPERVFLVGIAGSYDPNYSVQSWLEFDQVACYGIGVGSGQSFMSASEMGWNQWSSEESTISDIISIQTEEPDAPRSLLLTCCAASANDEDVEARLKKFPWAKAEDMEGFAVAAACKLSGVPLRIIRGISNRAGERNKKNWRIREAMECAETALARIIGC